MYKAYKVRFGYKIVRDEENVSYILTWAHDFTEAMDICRALQTNDDALQKRETKEENKDYLDIVRLQGF